MRPGNFCGSNFSTGTSSNLPTRPAIARGSPGAFTGLHSNRGRDEKPTKRRSAQAIEPTKVRCAVEKKVPEKRQDWKSRHWKSRHWKSRHWKSRHWRIRWSDLQLVGGLGRRFSSAQFAEALLLVRVRRPRVHRMTIRPAPSQHFPR